MLFVREQVDLDKRVTRATEVLGRQLLSLHDLDSEGGFLEVVADTELDTAQVLPAGTFMPFIVLRAWGELSGREI